MPGKFILETPRLILREFAEDDLAPFYVLGTDPRIIRYINPDGAFTSLDHAREVLLSHPLADYQKHGFGRWACVLKAGGEVIGFAGLKRLPELDEVDIAYRFLPAHWGLGLATEASRPALDYGFKHLGLKQIIGLVDPRNSASVHVLEKLGLRYEGMTEYFGNQVKRYVIDAPDLLA